MNAEEPRVRTEVRSRIEQALAWNDWESGLALAARKNQPALVLAEYPWSNSAKRLALVLENDSRLREKVQHSVVPILLHPDDRPDVTARLRWAAVCMGASLGPPLLMLVTPSGLPIAPYTTMVVEGSDSWPSLASVIDATVEAWSMDSEAIELEAAAVTQLVEPSSDDFTFQAELDHRHGGLEALPKSPVPQLLHRALDAIESRSAPDHVSEWLRLSLDGMLRGAMYDQLGRGFHRCARDSQWMVPHFEKIIVQNAQLASVYLRAAELLPAAEYRSVGEDLVGFCQLALRERVAAIESDSEYYTWTSRELLKQLEPSLVQTVSLYFGIVPDPHRQSLARQIDLDDFDQYSHEPREIHEARLRKGIHQLKQIRQNRNAPGTVGASVPSWDAETIRSLLSTTKWSSPVNVKLVIDVLESMYSTAWSPQYGCARGGKTVDYWLEDQVSLLSACIAAFDATNDEKWKTRSIEVATLIVDRFASEKGWLDRAGSETVSWAVIPDILPSTIETLQDAFQSLAALTGNNSYVEQMESVGSTQLTMSRAANVRFE